MATSPAASGAAAAITPGTDVVAYLCPRTDNDYYAFSAPACAAIDLLLTDLPANYSLALIDSAGSTIARAGGPGTTDRAIHRVAAVEGIYSVRVYPGAGSDSPLPYTLRVDLSEAEEPDEDYFFVAIGE